MATFSIPNRSPSALTVCPDARFIWLRFDYRRMFGASLPDAKDKVLVDIYDHWLDRRLN